MAERTLRVRLGAFLALSLAGLAGLVVLFGGSPKWFSNRVGYTIAFAEAPGLAVGTPVRKSGVPIGEVSAIDLDEETGVVDVGIVVDPRHRPRPSEVATIARGLLNGDTSLDFVPRTTPDGTPVPPAEPYPPGTRFPGETPINARGLLTRASEVLPTAQESLVRIQESFKRFEAATPKVENALDNIAEMADSAESLFRDLRKTNAEFRELLGTDDPPTGPKPAPGPAIPADRVMAQLAPADRVAPPALAEPPTVKAALAEIIALLRDVRPVADELEELLRTDGRELGRTARSIRETTDSIKATADNVNAFLTPENRKAVADILKNVDEGTGDLVRTIRLAAILLDTAEKSFKELNGRLAQSERVLANLETATGPVAENADGIVRDVRATVRSLNAAADGLNTTLTDVQAVVKSAGTKEGTVQKLLTDPALFNNLNAAAYEAARVLMRIEKVTKDLEVFADKIARKPETLGLGGVARPSTGLKEAPLAPLPDQPYPPIAPLPRGFESQPPAPVVPLGAVPNRPIPPIPGGAAPTGVPAFRTGESVNDRPPQ